MRLSLKTKFTLATSLLVLGVVTAVSGLYLGRLTRQVLSHADERARFVALSPRLPNEANHPHPQTHRMFANTSARRSITTAL